MKIALFGYGKMGRAIEKIALERGHQIVDKITSTTKKYTITKADIAIDFSLPNKAYQNIASCIEENVPVISGTTGWLDKYDSIVRLCKQQKGAFIYASNFSLGVNLFFELNKKLTELMHKYTNYNASITEIHHTQKLDKPSGTAITLAEQILEKNTKNKWVLGVTKDKKALPITSKRVEDVYGIHQIKFSSEIDEIEIMHKAKNRNGFALGAVIAAEWLIGKEGVYTMQDVLELKK